MDAESSPWYTEFAGMVQVWVTSLLMKAPQADNFSRLFFCADLSPGVGSGPG